MTEPIRVLVTAVGGDLGQALVKALRLSAKPIVCFGCDTEDTEVGSAFVESFHIVPRADDANAVKVLDQLCRALAIHAVVPGSEPEIYVLSRLGSPPKLPCGVPIVCQEANWIETYGDKLACMQALSGHVDLAPFADGTDLQAVEDVVECNGFPLVVKERRSSGSRSFRMAHNRHELDAFLAEAEAPFVQVFVDESGGEFSVGVFASTDFIDGVAFRRRLGPGGCSWRAESSKDPEVLTYALAIARETRVRGSMNIQVRKSSKGVRLLEINPRFSSLAAARAACGFLDVEWSLELTLGCLSIKQPKRVHDIRFARWVSELVDFGEGFGRVSEWDPREAQRSERC